jgi:hypothetical protein
MAQLLTISVGDSGGAKMRKCASYSMATGHACVGLNYLAGAIIGNPSSAMVRIFPFYFLFIHSGFYLVLSLKTVSINT